MVYSEKVQFCLANASRNERMASLVHEQGLRVSYAESANYWRRLAEQIKQLENGSLDQSQRTIADMARNLYRRPSNSMSEAVATAASQIAQSSEDEVNLDNAIDGCEQEVPRHSLEQPEPDQKEAVQNVGAPADHAETQKTRAIGQIDARHDPVTGQWECLVL
jgi:hypothetical protein